MFIFRNYCLSLFSQKINLEMLENSHIESIAAGDQEAFKKLHDELYKRLFYYVYQLTHDKELAEDYIQEAFLLFWKKRQTFSEVLAVKTYFYLTLRNKVMCYFRDRFIHKRILENMDCPEIVEESQTMIVAEVCGEVQRAISALPAQTQRVIRLSMLDMTVEEIAVKLNISPNTVKTLKKNGYKSLRQQLYDLKSLILLLLFY